MSDADQQQVQRTIVLHLLDGERSDPWTLAELDAAVNHSERATLSDALDSLQSAGVIERVGEHIHATPAAKCLDTLGLIAV